MTVRKVFTMQIRLAGELRASARYDDVMTRQGARLLDAYADNTGTVYVSYEADENAPEVALSLVLVPTGGEVPEAEGFLRTVTGAGFDVVHVYVLDPQA